MNESRDQQEFGNPAPEWFRRAEVYNGWYQPWSDEVVKNRLKGLPLVVGVPHTKEWIDKAHAQGVKVIPYVSFYKSMNVAERREANPGEHINQDSPFWKELDLGKHPEWMLYQKDGEVRRPFDTPKYPARWQQVCTNAPGYAEATLRAVQKLMDLGADGLFIDNVHPCTECFGAELGKHEHVEPDKNNKDTYKQLLKRVNKLVKADSPDKLILLNPGGVIPEYWTFGDAMMYESYICGGPSKDRRHDWNKIMDMAHQCKDALSHGKTVVALSYLGDTPFDIKDDAYFCYACAKLSGFHWADWFTLREHPARELLSLRTGRAESGIQESDRIHFRWFENGLVAVNSTESERAITPHKVPAFLTSIPAQSSRLSAGVFPCPSPPNPAGS